MEELKYPVGKYVPKSDYTNEEIQGFIQTLANFPAELAELCKSIQGDDLDLTYREEGWSIRQIVHHLADSHANMYIRVKNALSTDNSTVAGYSEKDWAEMPDNSVDIQVSIVLIEALHTRLVANLRDLKPEDYQHRTFFHAGYQKSYTIGAVLGLYSWHGRHHLEHIKIALNSR